jgi:hypothetical protein
MRRELSEACRKAFEKMIEVDYPAFRKDKSQEVPQGWYVWTWDHPSGLHFHIVLVISPTADEFTTEAGWDFDGKMPSLCFVGADELKEKPLRAVHFRTDILWNKSALDHWWKLILRPEEYENDFLYEDPTEDCLPLVEGKVCQAARKLKAFLMPLFEEIINIYDLPGKGAKRGRSMVL